jgi:hypothetical protein
LRKCQILEGQGDELFQIYLNCLQDAHEFFLAHILRGHKYLKMEQNPVHSKDVNQGVPEDYNFILDSVLQEAMDGEGQESEFH